MCSIYFSRALSAMVQSACKFFMSLDRWRGSSSMKKAAKSLSSSAKSLEECRRSILEIVGSEVTVCQGVSDYTIQYFVYGIFKLLFRIRNNSEIPFSTFFDLFSIALPVPLFYPHQRLLWLQCLGDSRMNHKTIRSIFLIFFIILRTPIQASPNLASPSGRTGSTDKMALKCLTPVAEQPEKQCIGFFLKSVFRLIQSQIY